MRILQLAAREPWLIRPDAVAPLLDIARRVDRLDRAALEPMVSRVEAVSAARGPQLAGARNARLREGGVAVIPVHGPIMRHAGMFDDVCGVTSLESLDADLRAALASPDVRSIILHVDSPGGMAADIGEMADKIRQADSVKPVRAYAGNQSASAAMWLAAGAREVVCSQTAMLGSIGVVLTANTIKEDGEVEIISTVSPNKRPDAGTDAGRAQLQAVVDRLGDEFVDGMARLRGVSRDHVLEKFGKGGQLVGRDAVAAGLADRIGSFDALVRECGGAQPARGTMDPKTENAAAAETPDQIAARVRAEVEAEIRAQADERVRAAEERAVAARVEGSLAKLVGKIKPAQAAAIKPVLVALAGDEPNYVALEGLLAQLPEHGLTSELVPGERPRAAADKDGDASAEDAALKAETEDFLRRTGKARKDA